MSDSKVVLPSSSRESIGRLFGTKADFKNVRDDPNCPNIFHIKELKTSLNDDGENASDTETKLLSSNLILEIVHLLFCRQWKFITYSNLPTSKDTNDTLLNDQG